MKEGFGNQINLCRHRGFDPGPPAQKFDNLLLDRQIDETFTTILNGAPQQPEPEMIPSRSEASDHSDTFGGVFPLPSPFPRWKRNRERLLVKGACVVTILVIFGMVETKWKSNIVIATSPSGL
uniref:Uncharacterized protein n=1 Tax=Timema douglasi TaxID=61478 RepID=A0A7R8VRI9_TIMDO|nr:unnamed protein product [Timema douglasi]